MNSSTTSLTISQSGNDASAAAYRLSTVESFIGIHARQDNREKNARGAGHERTPRSAGRPPPVEARGERNEDQTGGRRTMRVPRAPDAAWADCSAAEGFGLPNSVPRRPR